MIAAMLEAVATRVYVRTLLATVRPVLAQVRAAGERYRRFLPAALFALAVAAGSVVVIALQGRDHPGQVTIELGGPLVNAPLPEFIADLTPSGGRPHHVRLAIVAQVVEGEAWRLDTRQVEILAAIQAHLRALRFAELTGTAGAARLRQDVRAIINREIAPAEVRSLYFTQLLVD
jgi:flagellar basal body-associated protein FliL